MDTDYWIRKLLVGTLVVGGLILLWSSPVAAREVIDARETWRQPPPRQLVLAEAEKPIRLHRVQQGDSLAAIARSYRLKTEQLAASNRMPVTGTIFVGQYLIIPGHAPGASGPSGYDVQPGDTLWKISKSYGIGVEEIVRANNLPNPELLAVGQSLVIPGQGRSREGAQMQVSRSGRSGLAWPLRGVITSPYGPRWGSFHNGLDLAADQGDAIRAAASGRVIFAGWKGSYGRAIVIDHDDGFVTLYAHNSVNLVKVGEQVRQGEYIADVGSSGEATGPHLHFEVYRGNQTIDPLRYLAR